MSRFYITNVTLSYNLLKFRLNLKNIKPVVLDAGTIIYNFQAAVQIKTEKNFLWYITQPKRMINRGTWKQKQEEKSKTH